MKNWYADSADYKSAKPHMNTYYGIGETINRITLIIEWTLTAVVWMLTGTWEGFAYFFTVWAAVLHYIDIVRIMTVTVFKIIGMFADRKTDYYIDDGTSLLSGNT